MQHTHQKEMVAATHVQIDSTRIDKYISEAIQRIFEACKRNNLRHDDSIQGSLLCIPKPGCHYIYNVRAPVSQPLLISPKDLSTQYRPPASNKRCGRGHGEWRLRRIYHIYNHINDRVTN